MRTSLLAVPAVRKFTRDRRASGVLATEITVHEPLAADRAADPALTLSTDATT